MASVLVADDHALIRRGLRELLERDELVTRVGEANSGTDALRQLAEQRWDLVVLDIHMPGRSGIDILHDIREQYPAIRVLILSGLSEKQYAVRCLRAGASGFVNKEAASDDLLTAVRTILNGRRYVTPTVAELLLTDVTIDGGQPLHAKLSERELQVFLGIASGKQISVLSTELNISVKTTSTYRTRVLEKMGMKCNADMTAYALQNGLLQTAREQ